MTFEEECKRDTQRAIDLGRAIGALRTSPTPKFSNTDYELGKEDFEVVCMALRAWELLNDPDPVQQMRARVLKKKFLKAYTGWLVND